MSDTNIFSQPLSRRSLLAATAASASAAALSLSPKAISKAYAGQELNLTIIQPHAIAGETLKKDFLAQTGVTLNFTVIPYDQVQAQATLDVQSGANKYDVHDYWYATIGALVDDKVVVDVTDLIEKDKAAIQPDDFIKAIYDPYTLVNGRRWGLPYDGDSHVLFYNTDILKRNGLAAPKTWDEYYTAVKTITEKEKAQGVYGAALLGFKVPIIIVSSFANRLAGFGGQFLKDGKPNLVSDEAIGAAEELQRVAPYALPTPAETAFDQALPAFLTGKVAFLEFWTDLGVRARDPANSKIVDKWDVSSLPVGGKNTKALSALNAGFGWAISSGSKKKELAWEFVKWATGRKEAITLLTTPNSGIDPTRVSLVLARPDAVLVDIEGTISSLPHVVETHYPFTRRHVAAYIDARRDAPEIRQALADIRSLADPGETELQALYRWIHEDAKAAPLKWLQGLVWIAGYERGELVGHIYPDAHAALLAWRQAGLPLHVFSSGSVQCQTQFYRHCPQGDLTGLFTGHFDLRVGAKVEPQSYATIASELGLKPGRIVFFSDNPRELEAASSQGLTVVQMLREGLVADGRFPWIDDMTRVVWARSPADVAA